MGIVAMNMFILPSSCEKTKKQSISSEPSPNSIHSTNVTMLKNLSLKNAQEHL